jgi:hypothetical protein
MQNGQMTNDLISDNDSNLISDKCVTSLDNVDEGSA